MCRAWHSLDADLQSNNREARGAKVIFTTIVYKVRTQTVERHVAYGRLLIEYYCSLPPQYIVYSVTDG